MKDKQLVTWGACNEGIGSSSEVLSTPGSRFRSDTEISTPSPPLHTPLTVICHPNNSNMKIGWVTLDRNKTNEVNNIKKENYAKN